MASLIARATAFATRVSRVGRQFVDERTLAEHIKHSRVGPARPSAAMRRRLDISSRMANGYEVYTVAPRAGRGESPGPGHVMYIHGGAYVEGIFRWHWYFIARMVERLGMTFTVPLYPLAPEHDCAAASAVVLGA
jgi:acetyl esterase/lipase